MREAVFILFVAFLVFGLTALRYRKQIAMLVGLGRMLQEGRSAKAPARMAAKESEQRQDLVSCARCGTWTPKASAIRFDAQTYYCSKDCVRAAVV